MAELERYESRQQSDGHDDYYDKTEYLRKLAKVRSLYASETKRGVLNEGAIVQHLIEDHGFKFVVLALKPVSSKAKALFEKYKSSLTKRR